MALRLWVLLVVASAVLSAPPPPLNATQSLNGTDSPAVLTRRQPDARSPRPGLSRVALLAAARASMAARAAEALRAAGLRATLRPLTGPGAVATPPGTVLVVGPVASEVEPQCDNITSVTYSIDMLLGTWYVVSVISPMELGPICGGFQLTKLNVNGTGRNSEAVIVSRFGRQPGGPVAYVNRTMLVTSEGASRNRAAALQEQLAVTYYAPDGRLLTITACSPEGERLTYVYGRQPAPPPADAMGALRRGLADAGVAPDVSTTTSTTTEASEAPVTDDPQASPEPPREPFDVTDCGW